ncbi:hypothetical protein CHUAL_004023 [Chamberlinius hualienensis]
MAGKCNLWNSVIEDLISKGIVDKITLMLTDEERVKVCYESKEILSAVETWKEQQENFLSAGLIKKSDIDCENTRREGNELFGKKCYKDAAKLYTKALALCPSSSSEKLALCYANRSAANVYLENYKVCLVDIERALKLDCPLDLQFKLNARKANCCFKLQKYEECVEVSKIALGYIDDLPKSSLKYKEKTELELKELIEKAKKLPNSNSVEELEDVLPNKSYGENVQIPNASAAICLKYSSLKGRFTVANREIEAGDVLFVEKPYASVLLPNFNETHCHHCYQLAEAAVPCENCTVVRFCSFNCRNLAYKEYHDFECKWLPIFYKMGIIHLVIRLVLTVGVPYLLKNESFLKSLDGNGKSETCDQPLSGYNGVYSLVTNSTKVKPKDMFYYSVSAVLIGKLLEEEVTKHSNDNSAKYFVGSVCLRHIQQLICNANAITGLCRESSVGKGGVEIETQERIATAIYPSASLMNHSCEPNIISSYMGNVIIVKAANNISCNDEIFNCYGPHYLRLARSDRMEALLQQYYFECSCQHCSAEPKKLYETYRCKSCGGSISENSTCSQCHSLFADSKTFVQQYQQSLTYFKKSKMFYEQDDLKESLNLIRQCVHIQNSVLFQCHPQLLISLDFAARVSAELEIYDLSADFLRQTLSITEKLYGNRSIELANELQKYTDVLGKQIVSFQIKSKDDVCNLRSKCNDAAEAVEKGLTIFKLLYGSSHESSKEMADKLNHLQEIIKGLETINQQM